MLGSCSITSSTCEPKMIRRLRVFEFYIRLLVYLLPVAAFSVALMGLGSLNVAGLPQPGSDFEVLLMMTLIWVIATEHFGVTSIDELFVENTGVRNVVKAWGATYMTSFTLLFFYRSASLSRVFFVASAALLLALTLLAKAVFRLVVRHQAKPLRRIRILMIGADDFAVAAARRLEMNPLAACEIHGFVRFPNQVSTAEGVPVYELDEIDAYDFNHVVDDLVIATEPGKVDLRAIVRQLEPLCLPIRTVVDFGRGVIVRDKFFNLGGLNLLDIASTPAESLSYMMLKRVFDITFSLVALIVLAPIMAVIAVAVKLTSPGPILFAQERVGLNGRLFTMYKFRTMRVASDTESDTKWTTSNDPRRTPIGTVLRKTSLDELPQFFNVLKGDMSVVGPRPERPHFVEQFADDVEKYNHRHRLKVGITGWAQVNGWRGDTSIERRIECDLYYLQNWSFSFDLRIIAQTIWSCVAGRNAY